MPNRYPSGVIGDLMRMIVDRIDRRKVGDDGDIVKHIRTMDEEMIDGDGLVIETQNGHQYEIRIEEVR